MVYEVPSCVVCLQELCNKLSCTPCGHIFHSDCIVEWVGRNLTCPLCRERLYSSRLLSISYEIIENAPHKKQDGDNQKLRQTTSKIASLEQSILTLRLSEETLKQAVIRLKDKKNSLKAINITLSSEYTKYKESYEELKQKYDNTSKVNKELQNIKKLIDDLSRSESLAPWINSTQQEFGLNDQVTQFHSALLITSNNLNLVKSNFKDLRRDYTGCKEKINNLEKQIKESVYQVKHIEDIPLKVRES